MKIRRLLLLLEAVAFVEFLLEAFDTSGRIDEFLLARKERVALRANFRVNFLHGAARLKGVAATAANLHNIIFWMNIFFHKLLRFSLCKRKLHIIAGHFLKATPILKKILRQ